MIRPLIARLAVLAALPLLFSACGDDSAGPSGALDTSPTTLRTDVDPARGSFEIKTGSSPSGRGNGYLILRGSDVRWDEDEGVLLADFEVENGTDETLPEPVVLTFLELQPEGATVENSDNDETGPGAQILFEFENDDAMWAPGEVSLPRTVAFGGIEEGTAVAFFARIDVGLQPGAGAIGGVVWHDEDADGEIDQDEEGLGGVTMILSENDEPIRETKTRPNGSYEFGSLPAGVYVVNAIATDGWLPTTAPRITVVLPENGSFLAANFGCRREGGNGEDPVIRVGDRVHAKGEYDPDPDRLVAFTVAVCRCRDRHSWVWGSIRGPATDVDPEAGMVWLMGTPIVVLEEWENTDGNRGDDDGGCPKPHLDEVEKGDRLRADPTRRVDVEEDEILATWRLKCWNGRGDRVMGVVQDVREGDNEGLRAIRVLDTWIEITELTDIYVWEDDDDHDGDDGDDDGDGDDDQA